MVLTSSGLQTTRRTLHEVRRRLTGQPHVVEYFHDLSDPYSLLTVQVLADFKHRYSIELRTFLISGSPPDMMPSPEAFRLNAFHDVVRVANRLGYVPPTVPTPDPARIATAERVLAGADDFIAMAPEVTETLWADASIPEGPEVDPATVIALGDQSLAAVGHYQGGCFAYGGETYWGLDRLHYLENRLQGLGLGQKADPIIPQIAPNLTPAPGAEIEFFFSFRSPYSYLAFDRARALARDCQANLILRPVLPMLMRGLPVPKAKSSYILRDCTREARRLGIPFGRISDPLGAGVERGYALLDHAEAQGRLADYCSAFLTAVWSQGIDAATETGLAQIAEKAGLDWQEAKAHVHSDTWRNRVEANQARLQEIGLWGVPSFHVNGQSIWGQDRLWAIADLLRGS